MFSNEAGVAYHARSTIIVQKCVSHLKLQAPPVA